MSNSSNTNQNADTGKVSWTTEFIAGLSTYLTLSYVFLLNPILLAKTGISISAAFFGTVVAAFLATLLMGLWAKVPFAVASAPSITTFFVSYVCLELGLSWQAALAAVVLSGFVSIVMTWLTVRQRLIQSIPPALSTAILCAVGGFLVANGLLQAKVISYSGGILDFAKISLSAFATPEALVCYVGLTITLIFRIKRFKFAGGPLLGILGASIVAAYLGIKASSPAQFSFDMFSAILQLDFKPLFDVRFLGAVLVFFIIDFFGGVGKFIGLFAAMGNSIPQIPKENMKRALYADSWGNVFGGLLGASSLAVFVSSAVGIAAGGRTGRTAVVTAFFMIASLIVMPLVGAIPVQATAGILIYVGLLLVPWDNFFKRETRLPRLDLVVAAASALIAFLTYGIDKAMLLGFLVYSVVIIKRGEVRQHAIMLIVTLLLLVAVIAQW